MSRVDEWDRDMSSKEVMRLRPDLAKLRVQESLRRKVERLEQAARDPKDARSIEVKWFKSRSALRNWHDPDLKLWRWGDGLVDKWSENHPENPDGPNELFMQRWQRALDTILELRKTSTDGLEQVIKEKDAIILHLERQVLSLMAQLDMANRR